MATFRDLKIYLERDGWTEEPNRVRGRTRTGDHWRYQKELADGSRLRTKASHGLRDEIGTGLFKHILRDQLQVSEDRLWSVVRGGPHETPHAPPRQATVPGWLVLRLLTTVGLSEDTVQAMTAEEAQAAWEDFRVRSR